MIGRLADSIWLRLACFLLSLAFLILAGRAFQTGDPLTLRSDDGRALLRMDRSVVAFPGDCTTVSWETSAALAVTLSYRTVDAAGSRTVCPTPWMAPVEQILKVTYANGDEQVLTITPVILSLEPRTWLFPLFTVLALLGAIQPWRHFPVGKRALVSGLIGLCLLLSAVTVFIQISDKTYVAAMNNQTDFHREFMEGRSRFNQWQYRVLADYVAEPALQFGSRYGVGASAIFTFMRLAQSALLFMLAAYYFHSLGNKPQGILFGLALTSWAIVNSNYDMALVFDTFGDVIFYLIAAILIVREKFIWLIPLAFVASLNRETSGLIPVMLIASQIRFRPLRLDRRVLLIGAVALAAWIAGQMLPRAIYGWRPGQGNYDHALGLEMIAFNVGREMSWRNMFATMNLIPLLAVLQLRRTSPLLKRFFWTILPVWFIIHFASAVVAESRLFLVPTIVVLVPIVLTGIAQAGSLVSRPNGVNSYAESQQAGTLPRALPEHEAGVSPGA